MHTARPCSTANLSAGRVASFRRLFFRKTLGRQTEHALKVWDYGKVLTEQDILNDSGEDYMTLWHLEF